MAAAAVAAAAAAVAVAVAIRRGADEWMNVPYTYRSAGAPPTQARPPPLTLGGSRSLVGIRLSGGGMEMSDTSDESKSWMMNQHTLERITPLARFLRFDRLSVVRHAPSIWDVESHESERVTGGRDGFDLDMTEAREDDAF